MTDFEKGYAAYAWLDEYSLWRVANLVESPEEFKRGYWQADQEMLQMEELYVVIGHDLVEGTAWICEDYNEVGDSYTQLMDKSEALEFVKEFDDLVESGNFSYKVAKLTFLD